MRAKLREIKEQLMAIRHEGTERQGRWLCQVLRGWMAYYAVPMSGSAISAFRHHMIERWHGALMRRSQRRRLTWMRMKKIADRHLPFPRILHPWPEKRFLVTIQGGRPLLAAHSRRRGDRCVAARPGEFREVSLAHATPGAATLQGRGGGARQQDGAHGLGAAGPWWHLSGA